MPLSLLGFIAGCDFDDIAQKSNVLGLMFWNDQPLSWSQTPRIAEVVSLSYGLVGNMVSLRDAV